MLHTGCCQSVFCLRFSSTLGRTEDVAASLGLIVTKSLEALATFDDHSVWRHVFLTERSWAHLTPATRVVFGVGSETWQLLACPELIMLKQSAK